MKTVSAPCAQANPKGAVPTTVLGPKLGTAAHAPLTLLLYQYTPADLSVKMTDETLRMRSCDVSAVVTERAFHAPTD